jgi:hypothetical protein
MNKAMAHPAPAMNAFRCVGVSGSSGCMRDRAAAAIDAASASESLETLRWVKGRGSLPAGAPGPAETRPDEACAADVGADGARAEVLGAERAEELGVAGAGAEEPRVEAPRVAEVGAEAPRVAEAGAEELRVAEAVAEEPRVGEPGPKDASNDGAVLSGVGREGGARPTAL